MKHRTILAGTAALAAVVLATGLVAQEQEDPRPKWSEALDTAMIEYAQDYAEVYAATIQASLDTAIIEVAALEAQVNAAEAARDDALNQAALSALEVEALTAALSASDAKVAQLEGALDAAEEARLAAVAEADSLQALLDECLANGGGEPDPPVGEIVWDIPLPAVLAKGDPKPLTVRITNTPPEGVELLIRSLTSGRQRYSDFANGSATFPATFMQNLATGVHEIEFVLRRADFSDLDPDIRTSVVVDIRPVEPGPLPPDPDPTPDPDPAPAPDPDPGHDDPAPPVDHGEAGLQTMLDFADRFGGTRNQITQRVHVFDGNAPGPGNIIAYSTQGPLDFNGNVTYAMSDGTVVSPFSEEALADFHARFNHYTVDNDRQHHRWTLEDSSNWGLVPDFADTKEPS